MPITDESFFNIVGEEISRKKIVQKMIDYYVAKLEIGETRVTDFNEGSEIRNLLESFAVNIYYLLENTYAASSIAFITTAEGEWLDLHGEHPLLNAPRLTGTEATGLLTFMLPVAQSTDTIIPADTLVYNADGLEYTTDEECVISAGETIGEVFATCLSVGEEGNTGANTITVIDEDENLGDVTVNNNEIFFGGTDYEEDDEYRSRLLELNSKEGFGSLPYYNSLALSLSEIHDVKFIDDDFYTKNIIVNTYEKPVDDESLINLLGLFTKTDNIVINHNFIVTPVNLQEIDLDLELQVGYELDQNLLEETVRTIFKGGVTSNLLEFEGLSIDQDLNKIDLFAALENVDGIIEGKAYIDDDLLETVECNVNSVITLRNINITQEVV